MKSGKMVKSLECFCQSYNKYFRGDFFCFGLILFNLACIFAAHHEIIAWKKSLEKVWNEFWIQKSVRTQ